MSSAPRRAPARLPPAVLYSRPGSRAEHSSSTNPLCTAQCFGRFSARPTPPAPRPPEIRAVTQRFKFLLSWALALSLLALPSGRATSRGQERAAATPTPRAWTLEEALASLALQPNDAYLQYVVLQLARRAGRFDDVAGRVQSLIPNRSEE